MSKVGVIIPFYGGQEYLPKLLDSIFNNIDNMSSIFVYVIDNSIPEERLTHDFSYNNVEVIEVNTGLGYGKACNIGYKKCQEDAVDIAVIVNQDGYFKAGALVHLVNTLINSNNDIISAMPLLTEYESDSVEAFFINVYLSKIPAIVSDMFAGIMKKYYEIPDLCGACFAIKLTDFKDQPFLFDPIYHMYFEDADLYQRFKILNKKVILVHSAIFHHKHSHTANINSRSIKESVDFKVSSYLHSIIYSPRKFIRSIIGWLLLEWKRLVENMLLLNIRGLAEEVLACFGVFKKLSIIYKRKSENHNNKK